MVKRIGIFMFIYYNHLQFLYVSGENCGISMIRLEIMPVLSDWVSEISEIFLKSDTLTPLICIFPQSESSENIKDP